jgi:hypothetical protein
VCLERLPTLERSEPIAHDAEVRGITLAVEALDIITA